MISVEIKSVKVEEVSGVNAKGKQYAFKKQTAYLVVPGEEYPQKILLTVDKEPYAPGRYMLADASFYVGKFNKLELGTVVLQPVPAARASAAA